VSTSGIGQRERCGVKSDPAAGQANDAVGATPREFRLVKNGCYRYLVVVGQGTQQPHYLLGRCRVQG
jgi:hypothetical protein